MDPNRLEANSAYAIVSRSSAVDPEFLLGENRGTALVAARWRRRKVQLAEPTVLRDYLLSYCAAGSPACTIVAGGVRRDYLQQTGSLTLLHADQPVQWSLESTAEFIHVHLYLSKAAVARVAREHGVDERALPRHNWIGVRDAWLESFFQLLISECDLYGRCGRLADSLFLDQTEHLLIGRLLFAEPAEDVAVAPVTRARVSPLRPKTVGRINDFLQQNLAKEVRLRHLAELADVSVDHFVRAFRQSTGTTPHQYLLQMRLNQACGLLRDDAMPIALVARQCGFSSPARFSVAFHDHYGLTPSQYRGRN